MSSKKHVSAILLIAIVLAVFAFTATLAEEYQFSGYFNGANSQLGSPFGGYNDDTYDNNNVMASSSLFEDHATPLSDQPDFSHPMYKGYGEQGQFAAPNAPQFNEGSTLFADEAENNAADEDYYLPMY